MESLDRDHLLRLLVWHLDAGADCAVGDAAVDWIADGRTPGAGFALPKPEGSGIPAGSGKPEARSSPDPAFAGAGTVPQRATTAPGQAPGHQADPGAARAAPPRFAAPAAETAVAGARQLAACAHDMRGLAEAIARFEGCGLKATATNTCVYRGAERARLMIIGEAPGRDEDLAGRPFVGRAGQLLDRMLAAIELQEADVHITNVVYWRPPGNRTPTAEEALVCRPFLERQVELVGPEAILLLGGAAAKAMFDTADGIMKVRGKWRDIEVAGRRVRALATLHPAYLLRTPAAKRNAWRDLLALKSFLQPRGKATTRQNQ